MVTAATWNRVPIFRGRSRLDYLADQLLDTLHESGWIVEAWVVFPNHYHFVASSPEQGPTLGDALRRLHSNTARFANEGDATPGRKVWFQFWDACIDFRASWFARLHYVYANPVKHGLVAEAEDYPWGCAAAWREELDRVAVAQIRSFKCDRLRIADDYPISRECAGLPAL